MTPFLGFFLELRRGRGRSLVVLTPQVDRSLLHSRGPGGDVSEVGVFVSEVIPNVLVC